MSLSFSHRAGTSYSCLSGKLISVNSLDNDKHFLDCIFLHNIAQISAPLELNSVSYAGFILHCVIMYIISVSTYNEHIKREGYGLPLVRSRGWSKWWVCDWSLPVNNRCKCFSLNLAIALGVFSPRPHLEQPLLIWKGPRKGWRTGSHFLKGREEQSFVLCHLIKASLRNKNQHESWKV